MQIYFKKHKTGLAPRFESDQEALDLISNGKVFVKGFKLLRNPDFHALVFAFLNVVFKFQDQFDDFELFRKRVKWYSGSYTEYMIDDKMITELDSWAFDKMDDMAFKSLFKRIKTACWKHFIPTELGQVESERLTQELLRFDQ